MELRKYEGRYAFMREAGKRATEAYEKAARWFDQLKELLLIEHGLVHTSELFHRTAHWFPKEFDVLGDILHQHHVIQDYGATPEFAGVSDDVSDMTAMAVGLLDDIILNLSALIRLCDDNQCWGVARQLETLQVNASAEKEKYLYVWKMFEESSSASSFDSWVAHLSEEGDG